MNHRRRFFAIWIIPRKKLIFQINSSKLILLFFSIYKKFRKIYSLGFIKMDILNPNLVSSGTYNVTFPVEGKADGTGYLSG